MEKFIKEKSLNISSEFQKIATKGCLKTLHYNIDVSMLIPDYAKNINITKEGHFVSMFEDMMDKELCDNPAIYIFRINKEIDSKLIIDAVDSLGNHGLNVPAHYKNPENNGILYIGKVKGCAWGRLIQHLGYHENTKSHGLQIQNWANKIQGELKLTYTVMFFEKEVADYIELLEVSLSKVPEFKPIIGKH